MLDVIVGRARIIGGAVQSPWKGVRSVEVKLSDVDLSPDSEYVPVAVDLFGMLSDITRVKLILALSDGEKSVGDLAEIVGKSPATVSQHLAKLRLARLVVPRQEGTRVFYSVENRHVTEVVAVAMHQAEHTLA